MRLLEQVLGTSLEVWHATREISSCEAQVVGYNLRKSEESELEEELLWDIIQAIEWRLETDKLNLNLGCL